MLQGHGAVRGPETESVEAGGGVASVVLPPMNEIRRASGGDSSAGSASAAQHRGEPVPDHGNAEVEGEEEGAGGGDAPTSPQHQPEEVYRGGLAGNFHIRTHACGDVSRGGSANSDGSSSVLTGNVRRQRAAPEDWPFWQRWVPMVALLLGVQLAISFVPFLIPLTAYTYDHQDGASAHEKQRISAYALTAMAFVSVIFFMLENIAVYQAVYTTVTYKAVAMLIAVGSIGTALFWVSMVVRFGSRELLTGLRWNGWIVCLCLVVAPFYWWIALQLHGTDREVAKFRRSYTEDADAHKKNFTANEFRPAKTENGVDILEPLIPSGMSWTASQQEATASVNKQQDLLDPKEPDADVASEADPSLPSRPAAKPHSFSNRSFAVSDCSRNRTPNTTQACSADHSHNSSDGRSESARKAQRYAYAAATRTPTEMSHDPRMSLLSDAARERVSSLVDENGSLLIGDGLDVAWMRSTIASTRPGDTGGGTGSVSHQGTDALHLRPSNLSNSSNASSNRTARSQQPLSALSLSPYYSHADLPLYLPARDASHSSRRHEQSHIFLGHSLSVFWNVTISQILIVMMLIVCRYCMRLFDEYGDKGFAQRTLVLLGFIISCNSVRCLAKAFGRTADARRLQGSSVEVMIEIQALGVISVFFQNLFSVTDSLESWLQLLFMKATLDYLVYGLRLTDWFAGVHDWICAHDQHWFSQLYRFSTYEVGAVLLNQRLSLDYAVRASYNLSCAISFVLFETWFRFGYNRRCTEYYMHTTQNTFDRVNVFGALAGVVQFFVGWSIHHLASTRARGRGLFLPWINIIARHRVYLFLIVLAPACTNMVFYSLRLQLGNVTEYFI